MRKTRTEKVTPVLQKNRQPFALEGDAPWGGFVNIRLDEAQISAFHEWQEECHEHVYAYLDEMLGVGLKASVSYDAAHECYIVALTGALMDSAPASRFCSTSRASTLLEVFGLTVWKHTVLTRGDYSSYRPRDSSFMSFG